jgi:hypothetical protein
MKAKGHRKGLFGFHLLDGFGGLFLRGVIDKIGRRLVLWVVGNIGVMDNPIFVSILINFGEARRSENQQGQNRHKKYQKIFLHGHSSFTKYVLLNYSLYPPYRHPQGIS